MIDQKTVYAILSDSSLNQTRAQVEALLEKELQKPENEMDAALVEEYVLTLAEMDGADYKPLVPAQPPLPAAGAKRKRRNRSRWLRYSLAAACLCAFMLLVASATGKYVQPSIPAVTVYRDCAVIHYDLLKDMEPMVYVNYCEESDLMNPRCQKLSELDAKTAEMDKEWYAKRDPKTEEPTKIAKIYVTVYYAEKGEQMLHHFKKSMDIGNGHGGIVSQLKYDNEMKLTDEYWINYQKGKGSEEFQKYMEDLTDMQNHVLPYLQSFCNLEEKGVKERREQQIAERYEGRADERVTSTEANEVVKDVGKTDRKPAQQKQAVDGKDKKLSIHERLEINKRIIQEKQGKDKTERGVDLGVRTV